MELQVPKIKRNTGLLPCFENLLATSSNEKAHVVDQQVVNAMFRDHRKQVQRLIDQSKAIPPAQFAQEMADLLNRCLAVDHVWISDVNLVDCTIENIKGIGSAEKHFDGQMVIQPTSPFWGLNQGACIAEPGHALLKYSNCPYLQKFNVNAFVLHRIEARGTVRGLIAVMSETSIEHPDEICDLIKMVADFLAEFLYSEN